MAVFSNRKGIPLHCKWPQHRCNFPLEKRPLRANFPLEKEHLQIPKPLEQSANPHRKMQSHDPFCKSVGGYLAVHLVPSFTFDVANCPGSPAHITLFNTLIWANYTKVYGPRGVRSPRIGCYMLCFRGIYICDYIGSYVRVQPSRHVTRINKLYLLMLIIRHVRTCLTY